MEIVIEEKKFKVHKIEEAKGGVKVAIENVESGNSAMISNGIEPIVFELKECEKSLLGLRG